MTLRIGINGFGRIGRNFLRALIEDNTVDAEVVAVNDLSSLSTSVHLLKYDTTLGRFAGEVKEDKDAFTYEASNDKLKQVAYFSEKNPEDIPWDRFNVDLIIESTGFFTTREAALRHNVANVIISAPGKDVDYTVVYGVNESALDFNLHKVISNASCTTNCLAPVAKVIHENFGITKGFMTTIHAYTNDQKLLDAPHKDLRRARAGASNIVPTSTGAAQAVALVLPELKGKLSGHALRVPVINGSLVDLTVELEKETTTEEFNETLRLAAKDSSIIEYTEDLIVSSDILGNSHSAIIDSNLTSVDGKLATVSIWYDNEWAYSMRLVDLVKLKSSQNDEN